VLVVLIQCAPFSPHPKPASGYHCLYGGEFQLIHACQCHYSSPWRLLATNIFLSSLLHIAFANTAMAHL